jgi:DNA-directed RNA polymerase specialized sigma24 family protein
MRDAYVRAYEHVDEFEERARFSTSLTSIAVHEAVARLRRRNRFDSLDSATRVSRIGRCPQLPSATRSRR